MSTISFLQLEDFSINDLSLDDLKVILPQCEAKYSSGKTIITIPNPDAKVPLDRLFDRVSKLSKDHANWTEEQEKTFVFVASHLEGFYRKEWAEKKKRIPECLSWICWDPFSCFCCTCPSKATLQTVRLNDRISSKYFKTVKGEDDC